MKIMQTPQLPLFQQRQEAVAREVAQVRIDAKQTAKEHAQQQIAEMEAARNDMGEDNPKAQLLIDKFKSGKKLTPEEMIYVRKHAPGMADYIDRITREREVIELSMKIAPSKMDVQMVAYRASKQLEKYSVEDADIRAKHLADAKHAYEQTDEYKEKPSSPLQKQQKLHQVSYKKSERQAFTQAISIYSKGREKEQQHMTIDVT